jgi:dethiobiotin synthetase
LVPDLLVTGTDTGVGKTLVAAALLVALRERGLKAVGFKPAETGLVPGEAADSDILLEAGGIDEPLAAPLLRLAEPLAPAVAAERAGEAFDPAVAEARVSALRDMGYSLVVEGAGGVTVPLAWNYTALDLAARTGLHAVVVGRAGLGALNHCVLTVEALRGRGVPIHAVVLNGADDPLDLAQLTNPAALARLLPGLHVVVLPQLPAPDGPPWRAAAPLLAPLLDDAGLTGPSGPPGAR